MVLLQLAQFGILSRFLSKEDFGLYALVTIVLNAVQQLSSLGIGAAVIQRPVPSKDELSSLYWLNVISGIGFSAIVALCAWPIATFFEDLRLVHLLLLATIPVAFAGFSQQFQYLLQKNLEFGRLALVEIVSSATGVSVAIAFASKGAGAEAFLYGIISNHLIKTPFLFFFGSRYSMPGLHFSRNDLRGYLRFGVFLSGQNIVNIATARIDSIIIGKMLGPTALGLYFFAQQFTSQIFIRITPIITRVAFPVFSAIQHDRDRMRRGYGQMIQLLAMVIFPMLLGLALVSDEFLELFFAPEWQAASRLIQILAAVALLKSIISPIGSILMARGRSDVGFYMNIYLLIQVSLCLFVGSHWGIEGVAWALFISTLIAFVVWLVVQQTVVSISAVFLVKNLRIPLMATAVMAIAVSSTKAVLLLFQAEPRIIFVTCVLAGVSCYGAFVYRFRNSILQAKMPSVVST